MKPTLNTGASILYLGSPSFSDGLPTQLTMLRTSDGSILWQYPLGGTLDVGEFTNINLAIQIGQGLPIVDGPSARHGTETKRIRLTTGRKQRRACPWSALCYLPQAEMEPGPE